jgi:hypothetical protein
MVETNRIEISSSPLPSPEEMAGQTNEEFIHCSVVQIGSFVSQNSDLLPPLEERRFTGSSGVSYIDTHLLNGSSSPKPTAEIFAQAAAAAAGIGYRDMAHEAVKRALFRGREEGTLAPVDVLRIINNGVREAPKLHTTARNAARSEENKQRKGSVEHCSQNRKVLQSHARVANLKKVTYHDFPKAMTHFNQVTLSFVGEVPSGGDDYAGDQSGPALVAA